MSRRVLRYLAVLTACGTMVGAGMAGAPVLAGQTMSPVLTAQQSALVARARTLGVADVATLPAPNGGFVLDGRLGSAQFSVAFPANWRGNALLFAHGYATPGTPTAVAANPLAPDGGAPGLMRTVYDDGYAVGHSAYDKSGMAVESGTRNTLRLRDLLVALGARRMLVAGGSMGGNIVMSLIEQHPKAFDGAISACGVTDGWEREFRQLVDMRAAYNVLTEGTPYALPGEHDITKSAYPMDPPAGQTSTSDAYRNERFLKIAMPIAGLVQAARANPDGREARIVRQVASIGGFEPELASLAFPLITVSLAMDDLNATLGGPIYGNVGKVYASPELTATEAQALNARIQRISASPAAVAMARRWHQSTGHFRTPLITIHNRIDSLVPYAQSEALGRIVAAAGNGRRLVQYAVAGTKAPLPVGGVSGYTHCGFSPEQMHAGWKALKTWVETGRRPAPDAVK